MTAIYFGIGALFLSAVLFYVCLILGAWNKSRDTLIAQYARPESKFLRIDDAVELHVIDEGQGPALILLHGHWWDLYIWDKWAEILTQDFRVIRFDRPGYGLTSRDESMAYTVDRQFELISGLADHLDIDCFTIVGTSAGGMLAFRYTAAFPERVNGLILVNSGGLPRKSKAESLSQPTSNILKRWLHRYWRSYANVVEDAIKPVFAPGTPTPKGLAKRFQDCTNRIGANAERRLWLDNYIAQYEKLDVAPILAQIKVPTLIQWTTENQMLPVSEMAIFERLLANAPVTTITYPGGHLLVVENGERSARDAAEFVKQYITGVSVSELGDIEF